ncbi:MAG: peptidoglycan-binding domain-containing protein [Candidatus Paceibacterota bacterium]|jgi:hypothetical protein
MIKKLKLSLLIAVLSLFAIAGYADAAALTFSSNTNIPIGGNTYVISSGSVATTLAVSGNTITVDTTGAGGSFTLTSSIGAYFNNNAGLTSTCAGGTSSIVVPVTTSVIITPFVGTTCSAGGSGSLSSGGSATSTVAQSTSPVTVTVTPGTSTTPAVTMTTQDPGCSGGNKYSTSTGNLCVNTLVKSYDFGTKTLKNGSKGEAVKELQRFLNAKLNLGLVVDGKLGPKTIKVIKQWQKDHGLVADGLIGAKTKAKMNAEAASN